MPAAPDDDSYYPSSSRLIAGNFSHPADGTYKAQSNQRDGRGFPIAAQPARKSTKAKAPVVSARPKCRGMRTVGRVDTCQPHVPPEIVDGPVEWIWVPWRLAPSFLGLLVAGIVILLVAGVAVIGSKITARRIATVNVSVGIVLLIFCTALSIVAIIVGYNYKLREALAYTRGKQVQALEVWPRNSNPGLAKDMFHEESVGSIDIFVLRDGSVEIRNRGLLFNYNLSNILVDNLEAAV